MSFPSLEEAFQLAKQARENAHAKYSNYRVGSAVKLQNIDKVYAGCNIENSSYGATRCAEQVAVLKAISENPGAKIDALLLVTDNVEAVAPCGFCLQITSEFAHDETEVILCNLQGVQKIVKLSELLPYQFSDKYL